MTVLTLQHSPRNCRCGRLCNHSLLVIQIRSAMSFVKPMRWLIILGLIVAGSFVASPQAPTPASVLGHTPGEDFYLADYADTIRYFHALAAASDRIKMFTVGKSTRGQDIEVAV